MQSDAKAIAEGLSKAQREFLSRLYAGQDVHGTAVNHRTNYPDRVGHNLAKKGLVSRWTQEQRPLHELRSTWHKWALTPLGLAIKAQLERTDDDRPAR